MRVSGENCLLISYSREERRGYNRLPVENIMRGLKLKLGGAVGQDNNNFNEILRLRTVTVHCTVSLGNQAGAWGGMKVL